MQAWIQDFFLVPGVNLPPPLSIFISQLQLFYFSTSTPYGFMNDKECIKNYTAMWIVRLNLASSIFKWYRYISPALNWPKLSQFFQAKKKEKKQDIIGQA